MPDRSDSHSSQTILLFESISKTRQSRPVETRVFPLTRRSEYQVELRFKPGILISRIISPRRLNSTTLS